MDLNKAERHVYAVAPSATFYGPPADRMAGRPSLMRKAQAQRSPVRAAGNLTPAKTKITIDDYLNQAVFQGVISSGERGRFKAAWQADPDDTRAYLEKLGLYPNLGEAPGANPSKIVQASVSEDESYMTQHLSHAERARIAAAREGKQTTRYVSEA